MSGGLKREREIRMLHEARIVSIPVPEKTSDDDAQTAALAFSALLYEREVTPWRGVLIRPPKRE